MHHYAILLSSWTFFSVAKEYFALCRLSLINYKLTYINELSLIFHAPPFYPRSKSSELRQRQCLIDCLDGLVCFSHFPFSLASWELRFAIWVRDPALHNLIYFSCSCLMSLSEWQVSTLMRFTRSIGPKSVNNGTASLHSSRRTASIFSTSLSSTWSPLLSLSNDSYVSCSIANEMTHFDL